uniref:Uncharacterized protein n=1 Tax=Cacopsylla melanoneura TaxID=428564 RepID=A0A8D8QM90_9HEMI
MKPMSVQPTVFSVAAQLRLQVTSESGCFSTYHRYLQGISTIGTRCQYHRYKVSVPSVQGVSTIGQNVSVPSVLGSKQSFCRWFSQKSICDRDSFSEMYGVAMQMTME